MLGRKQVITMVSIAVISFLIGTNVITMATESGGNPWDKVWSAISELQGRINKIEEEQSQVKTIRFLEPAESVIYSGGSAWIANFTWTPKNTSNNALLSLSFYAESKCSPIHHSVAVIRAFVGNREVWSNSKTGYLIEHTEYQWSPIFYFDQWDRPMAEPNQSNYEIRIKLHSNEETSYFRNINVIITVADGLPASN